MGRLVEWDGRTSKAHRTDIRKFTGFRECSVDDEVVVGDEGKPPGAASAIGQGEEELH